MSKASSRHSLRGEFDDWLPLQPAGTVLPCLIGFSTLTLPGGGTRITEAYLDGQLKRETGTVTGTGKAWSGLSVGYGITAGRRSGREAALGAITVPAVSYAYATSSGALESVSTAGAGSTTVKATYRSTAATGWNDGVTYSVGTSTKLSSTRTPDTRGRLDAVSWANGSNAVLSGHDYTLDAMNRRTAALRQDGSKWNYGYNLRGEVTSAAKADYASVPEPGKQYGFAFDGIGNRSSSTVSSLADNEVLRSTAYTPNARNQYEEITHPSPGWLVLRGRVNAQSSVTIDGNAPTLLSGGRWHHEQSVDNSAGAVRRVAEVTAMRPDGGTNNAAVTARHKGALFIPPPVEVVTHDDDGNQTSNAHWSYTWDGENRLVVAEESLAILLQPPGSGPVKRQRVECAYDAQGRRIYKRVLTAEGMSTTFILKQSVVFLYDGWNMIAEIDTTTSARLIRSYEWGTDLSGTMDGAGGVGGLLVLRTHPSTINAQPSTGAYAPTYDGNGNVMELVNLANGSVSARYEYGAFGETISVDGGAVADANPIRFSTKYLDGETGLLYYTHRYYDAANGRWPSRDPIEEQGGLNLYGMVRNDPVNFIDYLGLDTYVLLYYSRADQQAFKQAAETQKRELEASSTFNKACDKVIIKGALTAQEFETAWNQVKTETTGSDPNLKVKEVRVFSHSGPGSLYFQGSSLNSQQIATLSGLNWKSGGQVVCHGCNSGVNNASGQSVAGQFAQGQGVPAQGQTGYSQFSEDPNKRWWFTRIGSGSTSVYLWSHGDGGKDNTLGPTRPPNTVQPPQQPTPQTPAPANPTPPLP